MFNIFKRTKIEQWEIKMLLNIFNKLPAKEFESFSNQIKSGLLKGVLIGVGDIPGYISFTFNSAIYKKYYNSNGSNFRLSSIKIFDILSNEFINLTLYFSYGVIDGYSIDGRNKYQIDPLRFDVSNFQKFESINLDYEMISAIIKSDDLKLINPADVYKISLNGKEFYHLKDIEDGDFVAIDMDKVIYVIRHDPLEINESNKSLANILHNS